MRAIFAAFATIFLIFGLWSCNSEADVFGLSQFEIDQEIIKDHLAENNITNFKKTNSGIYYYVLKEGTGALLPKDSIIYLGYEGRLPYSYIFESSFAEGDTLKVQNGTGLVVSAFAPANCDSISPTLSICDTCPKFSGSVIPGWVESISLMKKGERTRFYLPSYLGYGSRATGNIPSNSVLIFDIEAYGYVGIEDSCIKQ